MCEACFVPEVQEHVYVCLSDRFDTVLGKAVYNRASVLRRRIGKKYADGIDEADNDYVLAIILNNNIFWQISHVGKTEIVVHEICHIIDFYLQLNETGRIIAEHNDRWKRMMWACGFTPREYVPHNELGIAHKYKLYCNKCDQHINTSRTRACRVRKGSLDLYCRACQTKLVHSDLVGFNLDKCRPA